MTFYVCKQKEKRAVNDKQERQILKLPEVPTPKSV